MNRVKIKKIGNFDLNPSASATILETIQATEACKIKLAYMMSRDQKRTL